MKPSFVVIPAVDIKGGRCVRLRRGLAEEETVFDDDPVRAALHWEQEGARLLHVVDLDGAFAGKPVNGTVVKEIARTLRIPVEVGGGIRDTATAVDYVESGLERVVVGTAAFSDASWLSELAGVMGERLAVGIDVKEGKVAVKGWVGVTDEEPAAAVKRLADAGVRRIIYTDIMRDGTLEGPNFEGLEAIAKSTTMPVVASGGVASLADVERIAGLSGLGIEGVIVGLALYTGKLKLEDAIAFLREKDA